ncbi:MAG: ADP-ribosylglycohydrolase family protein [Sedimentisphaerales bacterium]|nr:ADP-ribosylglycohydrolase family protein [Sedimentisphaerales bacterium]
MKRTITAILIGCCFIWVSSGKADETTKKENSHRLPVAEYVDKMKAGWIGQMAGVGWGAPTEFKHLAKMIPEGDMPAWTPEMINQFEQDDIYVEMTFLRTLDEHGLDVSIRQAGIDFANSGYQLWHANLYGRENLRQGIAPPDSGHPKFSKHSDDIDYQIEADYSGLISPGMPNQVIELGEKFGRLMNYGDGVYGGQFVGAAYAAAFFENDMETNIKTALQSIPSESQYHECISDVLKWYKQYPNQWQKCWELIQEKYHDNPDYRRWSCSGTESEFNIDAKINGAYIVMGLLYGKGDPDNTIIISTRCGQDSDCNPSNAAGILFTTIGYDNLPARYVSALNEAGKFSHTPYDFPTLIKVCETLTRQAVYKYGGTIEKGDNGEEILVIPIAQPKPGKPEKSWAPGPIANSRFSPQEKAEIYMYYISDMDAAIKKFAPGWKVTNCGDSMEPGLHARFRGKANVLVTHPAEDKTSCIISRKVTIPENKKTYLFLQVSHHPQGDWMLKVRADGKELLSQSIGRESVSTDWADIKVDLSAYAGKEILLELLNEPSGWAWEAAYWARVEIVSR